VLGSPISHSRSPQLHRAAYRTLGLEYDYTAEEVDADALPGFLDSRGDEWLGFSLTMPLKRAVIAAADEIDPVAEAAGTANTLLFADSGDTVRRRVFNTDVPGMVRALHAAGCSEAGRVHILGSGATAVCALLAAARLGASHVEVYARTPAHAEWVDGTAEQEGVTARVRPLAIADRTLAVPDLVISTLPGGARHPELYTASTRRRALLFDVSYDPWPSALATAWSEVGGRVLSGLALLVHQALLQVRIFVAGDPDIPLDDEPAVLEAMLEAAGIDAAGAPIGDV